MALLFDATNERVDTPASSAQANLSAATYLFWFKCSSGGGWLGSKGVDASADYRRLIFRVELSIRFIVTRSGGDVLYQTDDATLTSGVWQCVAITFDAGGAATELVKVYAGTLSTPLAEVSGYKTTNDGSGGYDDDSSAEWFMGNSAFGDANLGGQLAVAMIFNRVLTLAEMRSQQFAPRAVSGCVGFWHLGFGHVGTQPDLSGQRQNASVTNATLGAHVPVRAPASRLILPAWSQPEPPANKARLLMASSF